MTRMQAADSHTLARWSLHTKDKPGDSVSWNRRQPRGRVQFKLSGCSGAKETPKGSSQTRAGGASGSPGRWCLKCPLAQPSRHILNQISRVQSDVTKRGCAFGLLSPLERILFPISLNRNRQLRSLFDSVEKWFFHFQGALAWPRGLF